MAMLVASIVPAALAVLAMLAYPEIMDLSQHQDLKLRRA
jgi:hypothetical protein